MTRNNKYYGRSELNSWRKLSIGQHTHTVLFLAESNQIKSNHSDLDCVKMIGEGGSDGSPHTKLHTPTSWNGRVNTSPSHHSRDCSLPHQIESNRIDSPHSGVCVKKRVEGRTGPDRTAHEHEQTPIPQHPRSCD